MTAKRVSMKGAKGLLENIPEREVKAGDSQNNAGIDQQNAVVWRKITVRFEDRFFQSLKVKLKAEGRTIQGYIDYLIRKDLENS